MTDKLHSTAAGGVTIASFAGECVQVATDLRWLIILAVVLIAGDFWWAWRECKMRREEAKTEETKTPSAYGGYLAEKETAFSTIRVIISTHSGEIVGCKVICDAKEGQTDLVTDENEANWAKAIVETQGAEIDTVTGATISSDAVKEAVTEILAKIR